MDDARTILKQKSKQAITGLSNSPNDNITNPDLQNITPFHCSADVQTNGRGRYDRTWISEPGNVYVTLALSAPAQKDLSYYPYLIGLSVLDSVQTILQENNSNIPDVTLKWPNDILIDQQKCAGILMEIENQTDEINVANRDRPPVCSSVLLIGIGVNIKHAPSNTPYPTTCLNKHIDNSDEHGAPSPEKMIHRILNHFDHYESILQTNGFDPIRQKWLTHRDPGHSLMKIHQYRTKTDITGQFHDISEQGALCLETLNPETQKKEITKIYAGDVFFL